MTTYRLNAKMAKHVNPESIGYSHWCEGCGHAHTYYVFIDGSRPSWAFVNMDPDKPTFTPSFREYTPATDMEPEHTLCHYTMTEGMINYLSDSDHDLKGQIVPLADIPSDYGFGGVAFGDLPTE